MCDLEASYIIGCLQLVSVVKYTPYIINRLQDVEENFTCVCCFLLVASSTLNSIPKLKNPYFIVDCQRLNDNIFKSYRIGIFCRLYAASTLPKPQLRAGGCWAGSEGPARLHFQST